MIAGNAAPDDVLWTTNPKDFTYHIDDTWHQYLVQPAEDLGLVDCALIAVARAFGTKTIASFDRSFDEVPGIVRVPSDPAAL